MEPFIGSRSLIDWVGLKLGHHSMFVSRHVIFLGILIYFNVRFQDSLGGNSRTVMIGEFSDASISYAEPHFNARL